MEEETREQSVALWTCDSDGGVHVLCNAQCTGESRNMAWRESDGQQKGVACGGSSATVYSINKSNSNLAFRTGVDYSSPLGKKWSSLRDPLKISQVAVGKEHIAVLVDSRTVLTSPCIKPSTRIPRDKFNTPFTSIPPSPVDLHHILMGPNDRLYGVTPKGDVHVYSGVTSSTLSGIDTNGEDSEELEWKLFSKPPPIARRGGFLSYIFSSAEKVLFIDAAMSADGNIFLLRENSPQELWQLAIKEVDFGGRTSFKSSWNSFKFKPDAPKVGLIAPNLLNTSELFAVTESTESDSGSDVVRLKLKGKTITVCNDILYHALGGIKITALASCLVTNDKDNSVDQVPKIYPKLPKQCCEKGNCPECKGKSAVINITEDMDWNTRYKEQLAAEISKWKRGEEYHLPRLIQHSPSSEEKRKNRKRTRGADEGGAMAPVAKRLSATFHKEIPRRYLLDGIDLMVRSDRIYKYTTQVQHRTLSTNTIEHLQNVDLEQEILPSFRIEEAVLNNTAIPLLHEAHSCPIQETESQTSMETESQHELVACETSTESLNESLCLGVSPSISRSNEHLIVGNSSTKYYTAAVKPASP